MGTTSVLPQGKVVGVSVASGCAGKVGAAARTFKASKLTEAARMRGKSRFGMKMKSRCLDDGNRATKIRFARAGRKISWQEGANFNYREHRGHGEVDLEDTGCDPIGAGGAENPVNPIHPVNPVSQF